LADIGRRTRGGLKTDTPLTEYFVQEARSDSSKHGNGIEKGASK
jgi:hypothetical protein